MSTKVNLPGVHGGVSQQSPHLRLMSQHSSATNVLFDTLRGIRGPRWGTDLLSTFDTTIGNILGIHQTSDGEHWVLHRKAGNLWVTPLNTMLSSVNLGNVGGYITSDSVDVLGILDTLIVTNKDTIVEEEAYYSGTRGQAAYAFISIPQVFETLDIGTISVRVKATESFGVITAGDELLIDTLTPGVVGPADTPFTYMLAVSNQISHGNLWPTTPSGTLLAIVLRDAQVLNGGRIYVCKLSHVSAAANEPGVGVDWATYWDDVGATASPDTWRTTENYYTQLDLEGCKAVIALGVTAPEFDVRLYSSVRAPDSSRFVHTTRSYETLPGGVPPILRELDPVFQLTPGHYVRMDHDTGTYVECSAPGHEKRLKKSTMPHELRYTSATHTWTAASVDELDDLGRRVGDLSSAPAPNIVGRRIQRTFFHRNRLGFLSDNYVVFSRAAAYWDFFPSTAAEVLDDDPISVFPSSLGYEPLLWAIPFNKQLFILGPRKQYALHSGYEALSPKTVAIDEATNYTLAPSIQPITLEASMVLPLNHGAYLGILEYHLNDQELALEGSHLSSHVPEYVPYDITGMDYVPSQKLLMFYKDTDIWLYKFYKDEQGKLMQAAWFHWQMPWAVKGIVHISGDIIGFITESKVYTMTFRDAPVILDSAVVLSAGVPLPVLPTGWLVINPLTLKISEDPAGTVFTRDMYYGQPVAGVVELSPLIIRDDNGLPRQNLDITLENIGFDWIGGEFAVEISGTDLPTRSVALVPLTYTMEQLAAGASYLEPYHVRFLCMTKAPRTTIRLKFSGHVPVEINNITYNLDIVEDWG